MVWLPDGEKYFENMFVRFDMIHERDRRTEGQTDGHRMTATAALMDSIARQKSQIFDSKYRMDTNSRNFHRQSNCMVDFVGGPESQNAN